MKVPSFYFWVPLGVVTTGFALTQSGLMVPTPGTRTAAVNKNLIYLSGGTFIMGSDAPEAFPNEGPAHEVTVAPFRIAARDVTNAEYAAFVKSTGYVTIAERAVDWEELKKQIPAGTPRPHDSQLAPGSLVFIPPAGPVNLQDMSQWWRWTTGASWRHPEGPDSDLNGRENHPVVQVAYDDALAYAHWAGARLPTEAEWEFASRGGRIKARYAWGETDPHPVEGPHLANTWTGEFPWKNTATDGFAGTSPVGSYPPNDYGLYDMAGNVWNWCSDLYRADTYRNRIAQPEMCGNPSGPSDYQDEARIVGDPSPPSVPGAVRRVTKGGSFLCSPSYCESYRPAARRGTPPDTGSSHIGFRLAVDTP